MARTTKSNITQRTVGPVPLAVEPTDPVPLAQSGSDSIWGTDHGRWPEVTVSVQKPFAWDAKELQPLNIPQPIVVPFLMRLKEVDWYTFDRTISLNVVRGGQVVATAGPNAHSEFDLLFQPNQQAYFITSSFIRLATSWTLAVRWEIVSRSVDRQLNPAEVLPNTAPAEPDTESERIPTPLSQPPDQLAAPVESHKTNRFAAWIRRQWK